MAGPDAPDPFGWNGDRSRAAGDPVGAARRTRPGDFWPLGAGRRDPGRWARPRVEAIMTESQTPRGRVRPVIRFRRRDRPRPTWRRRLAGCAVVLVAAVTAASFGYNLATGPAPRPPGLRMLSAGGFDTRYRSWGTSGPPVVLVPGAFETADTFAALGAALGTDPGVRDRPDGHRLQHAKPSFQRRPPRGPVARVPGRTGTDRRERARPGGALQRRGRRRDGGAARPPRRGRRGVPRRRRDAAGS